MNFVGPFLNHERISNRPRDPQLLELARGIANDAVPAFQSRACATVWFYDTAHGPRHKIYLTGLAGRNEALEWTGRELILGCNEPSLSLSSACSCLVPLHSAAFGPRNSLSFNGSLQHYWQSGWCASGWHPDSGFFFPLRPGPLCPSSYTLFGDTERRTLSIWPDRK